MLVFGNLQDLLKLWSVATIRMLASCDTMLAPGWVRYFDIHLAGDMYRGKAVLRALVREYISTQRLGVGH